MPAGTRSGRCRLASPLPLTSRPRARDQLGAKPIPTACGRSRPSLDWIFLKTKTCRQHSDSSSFVERGVTQLIDAILLVLRPGTATLPDLDQAPEAEDAR